MPRGDGTGPLGQGAFTGRGLGSCAGSFAGMGFGRGRSRGNDLAWILSILFGAIAGIYYVLQKVETKNKQNSENANQ